jgi:hypothetical protein
VRQPGDVFDYPFLWGNQEDLGIDNPKDRRTTIALSIRKTRESDGAILTHLLLLGITDSPRAEQVAVEVPPIERRRGGLTVDRAAHVVVSEYDYDIVPGSADYNPNSKTYGRFSVAFLDEIKRRFSAEIRRGLARRIDRTPSPGLRR